jgi:hypothetical protein
MGLAALSVVGVIHRHPLHLDASKPHYLNIVTNNLLFQIQLIGQCQSLLFVIIPYIGLICVRLKETS